MRTFVDLVASVAGIDSSHRPPLVAKAFALWRTNWSLNRGATGFDQPPTSDRNSQAASGRAREGVSRGRPNSSQTVFSRPLFVCPSSFALDA